MDEDTLRSMLPMGFGKAKSAGKGALPKEKAREEEKRLSKTEGTKDEAREAEKVEASTADEPSSTASRCNDGPAYEFDALKEYASLPLTRSIQLRDHKKSVCALAIDRSGARVATGSTDYDVKLWDFGGMASNLRPFKSFEPAENYPVIELAFAPYTKNILCLNAAPQPRVYSYDGDEIATYKKGDVFMRDMKHTTGHISDITCGMWNPVDDAHFMTGGTDSTVRLWDVDHKTSQKSVIVVRSRNRGTKTKVLAATYTSDARTIVAAAQDGALYMWSAQANHARPTAVVHDAHAPDQGASSVALSPDGHTLASRGNDDTVKLWDLRHLRKPLAEHTDLPSGSEYTNILWSPNGKQVLTGTASVPGGSMHTSDVHGEWGQLAVLAADSLATQLVYPVARSTVIRVMWHPRLNQVFVSTRDGDVHVYYDEHASQLGALLAVSKRARSRTNPFAADPSKSDPYADVPIILPEEPEHDDWLDPVYRKPQFPRNPKNARVPERPLEGRGKGGRIGRSALQPLVMDMWEGDLRSEDPREALLKYADKAKEDPRWTSAYARTQPNAIFDEEDDNDNN